MSKGLLSPLLNTTDDLSQGLVGAWMLDEGYGLGASDRSGNGNHGTLTGGVTWSGGIAGSAAKFLSGASGAIPGISKLELPFAIGARLYMGAYDAYNDGVIVRTSMWGPNYWGGMLRMDRTSGSGYYTIAFGNGGSGALSGQKFATSAAGTVTNSAWQTIVGIAVSATEFYMYIDGVQVSVTLGGQSTTFAAGTSTGAMGELAATGNWLADWIAVWGGPGVSAPVFAGMLDPCAGWRPDRRLWYAAAGGAGAQTITLAGISSGAALGAITVSPGAVSAILAGIASGAALGTVVVSPGAVSAILSGIASPSGLGAVALTPGTAGIVLDGIAGPDALGAVTLAPGGVSALLDGISAGHVLGSVTLTPGAASVLLDGIAGPDALGSLTLTPGAASIALAGIGSGAILGSLTATPGAVTVSLDGIPSGAVLGTIKVAIAGVGFVFLPLINRTFERVGPSMAGRQ